MTVDDTGPPRLLLAPGAEGRVPGLLEELGARRVLVVCTGRHRAGADRLGAALGARHAGTFAGAEPQVPRTVADAAVAAAREAGADWVVAHGGGTAIGVAKAVALERDVALGAVVTTYSGSERTDLWGITSDGVKRTGRDPRVLPRLVVYDPALVLGLRPEVAGPSLLNAMAHGVAGLLDAQAGPPVWERAEESLRELATSLGGVRSPTLESVSRALWGSGLAGLVLGRIQVGLHHAIAHVLGGSFGVPHAPGHAALLPHTLAYELHFVGPEVVGRFRRAFAHDHPAAAVFDLVGKAGAATRLADLGLREDQVPAVVGLVRAKRGAAAPEAGPLTALLTDALWGRRP